MSLPTHLTILGLQALLGRVARRGYPLQAPTDPDVPDYGIRRLGTTASLRSERGVHNPRIGQRVMLEQQIKAIPIHTTPMGAAMEPPFPPAHYPVAKVLQPSLVACNPLIRILAPHLQHQLLMLPCHFRMAVAATPGVDPL